MLLREAAALAEDLRERVPVFAGRAAGLLSASEWSAVRQVYLVGDGDSYHAACAAEMAFETIGGVTCRPMSAFRFAEYGSGWMRDPGGTLVVAATASGRTPAVLDALRRAREHGAPTVAITGTAGSPVTEVADRVLAVELPDKEPGPGVRSYQATLLGMLLLALRLGDAGTLLGELTALADVVTATDRALTAHTDVAGWVAAAPVMVVAGSGPNHGTAQYAAAKLVEGAGVMAMGQDLEEWCHVERWAYPLDMPVFVIAVPGRSHARAVAMAARARELGRRVVAVAHAGDGAIAPHAHALLPVARPETGDVREAFSPLVCHVFAAHLAAHVATTLGRLPFHADRAVT
ncbi:SIS domain-containing protein [Sphaerisporangium corydalis]|uniref:Glutamine--fructose-6-phosphate aminotransferase [isomerizing] n=1 Tax=Sphaerisporangium corydalis TaxID=1441875 RepID=A0ABV9EAS9_9ACTN|nr:SIS domain-containing protein [Sphaerisporangium corydalis]